MNYSFYELLSYFAIYSMLGFVLEQLAFGNMGGKLVKRGLLPGPYCPIYGFDALLIICNLMIYAGKGLLVAFLSFVAFAGMRILTGFLLKTITGIPFWASTWIVPAESVGGAFIGLVIVNFVQPLLAAIVSWIPTLVLMIGLMIFYGFFVSQSIDLVWLLFSYRKRMAKILSTDNSNYELYAKTVAEELRKYGSLMRRFRSFRRRTIKNIFKGKSHEEIQIIKKYMREYGE